MVGCEGGGLSLIIVRVTVSVRARVRPGLAREGDGLPAADMNVDRCQLWL